MGHRHLKSSPSTSTHVPPLSHSTSSVGQDDVEDVDGESVVMLSDLCPLIKNKRCQFS